MMAYYEVVEQNVAAQIDVSWVFQVRTGRLYGEPRWLAGGRDKSVCALLRVCY
ncbi:hypothetical protein GIB67_023350, partial [Kingdonia uniflora]